MATSTQNHVQVRLSGVHLCCDLCAEAVVSAVNGVPDTSCQFDAQNNVLISANSHESAQKALDAIADAGLHGQTDDPRLSMKLPPGLPAGNVHKLHLSGIHNCCQGCLDEIKGAIRSVSGVTGDTAAPHQTQFEVTGDFDATQLIRALNAAGFHARVKS